MDQLIDKHVVAYPAGRFRGFGDLRVWSKAYSGRVDCH